MTTENNKYRKLSIYLHWFMLLLLIITFATMELRGIFPKGSAERIAIKSVHYSVGLTVLLLVFIRIGVRVSYKMADIVPLPSTLIRLLAKSVHLVLYGFMIVMPIIGWVILSAEGEQVLFYGLSLPALVVADSQLAHSAEDIHKLLATIAYFIIGLHALAALFHHYIKRDNAVKRMLP